MAPLPLVTKLNLGNKRHTSHYDYLLKNGRGWKCKNVADAQVTAEIALREVIYVSKEIIAIGTGNSQAATLANTNNFTDYYFALKFNGVTQTGNFTFNPTSGQVSFIAPAGAANAQIDSYVSQTQAAGLAQQHAHC
ncbi:MAG: hypothetical protein SR3Q1_07000 [Quinella sp. 3Q1]|nr:hypothetical protein [Quinella sp. 3Q1]MBR6887149.1 hypothetical protein [Selenomonadaceae bacterium]